MVFLIGWQIFNQRQTISSQFQCVLVPHQRISFIGMNSCPLTSLNHLTFPTASLTRLGTCNICHVSLCIVAPSISLSLLHQFCIRGLHYLIHHHMLLSAAVTLSRFSTNINSLQSFFTPCNTLDRWG